MENQKPLLIFVKMLGLNVAHFDLVVAVKVIREIKLVNGRVLLNEAQLLLSLSLHGLGT